MAAVINFANVAVGNLVFGPIDLDLQSLAAQLQAFVEQGSRRYSLSKADIQVFQDQGTQLTAQNTLAEFLAQGNTLFDSLIYLADPVGINVQTRLAGNVGVPYTADEIAKALFVQWFFILTRGRVSNSAGTQVGTDMPNFLRGVLQCQLSPLEYANKLAKFDLAQINPGWVRYIRFGALGIETRNRLGLGLAGYRLLAPFKYLTPKDNLPAHIVTALGVARSFATQPASWDIHPATRSPNILTTYGPLNANLSNLALIAYEAADLQTLVANRTLFQMPQSYPQNRDYMNWTIPYVTGTANIF